MPLLTDVRIEQASIVSVNLCIYKAANCKGQSKEFEVVRFNIQYGYILGQSVDKIQLKNSVGMLYYSYVTVYQLTVLLEYHALSEYLSLINLTGSTTSFSMNF